MKNDVGQWPGARVTLRPIGEILPYARNARTHSPAQVARIKGSMAEFGFVSPLLVDESGVLIAGHGRLLAAHSLGFAEVPVMVAEGWTPAQIRAYRITDNQLTLLGGWDMELLEGEIEELQDEDYDLSLLGFDDDELQGLLAGEGEGAVDAEEAESLTLAERFGLPPFSVFNAREGWWQDRKRAWVALGIQSELGRGEGVTWGDSPEVTEAEAGLNFYRNRKKANATPGGVSPSRG